MGDPMEKMLKRKCAAGWSRKGLTLIEIVLTVGLLSLVTVITFRSMQCIQTIFNRSSQQIKDQGDLGKALNILKRDLREARQGTDVLNACDGNNPDGICIHESPILLSFKVPESTVGTETTYKTIRYTYDSSADTLSRCEVASIGSVIRTDIVGRGLTSVLFTQSTDSVVSVSFQSGVRSLVSEVSLRNRAA